MIEARLRAASGQPLACPAEQWLRPACGVDRRVLDRAIGPVLDVGCGPGRHVVALAERGVPTLGIDITPSALALARARGVPVLRRSIFERVPGTGRWATALLLDGNVGIGGDPVALLRRVAELLAPRGRVLVEAAAPGRSHPARAVRFEVAGRPGPWFPFAAVGADEVASVAARAGLVVLAVWRDGDRWFAEVRRSHGGRRPRPSRPSAGRPSREPAR
jgi:SAM-dependent methyltransferase